MSRRRLPLLGLGLAFAAGPARPGHAGAQEIRLVADTTYYRVEGRTLREMREWTRGEALRQRKAPTWVASMRPRYEWGPISTELTPAGCGARAEFLRLRIRYTIPRLVEDPRVPSGALSDWGWLLRDVWRHEEMHGLYASHAVSEMRDSLNTLREPTCAELRVHVLQSFAQVRAKYDSVQKAFDARERYHW